MEERKPEKYIKVTENVFIFNFIENNEINLKKLTRTFTESRCRVKIYDFPTYTEFHTAVTEITTESIFHLYNYIVIVVLDNNNTSSCYLSLRDGDKRVLINDHLLSRVQENATMKKVKRLFVIVTNQDDEEDFVEPADEGKATSTDGLYMYLGPKWELYGTNDQKVKNGGSTFVEIFCEMWTKYVNSKPINFICEEICSKMSSADNTSGNTARLVTSFPGDNDAASIFGLALSNDAIRDYF